MYSCIEACALLYGGDSASYQCSTAGSDLATINKQAFVSIWGVGSCPVQADTSKSSNSLPGQYNQNPDTSAYVGDNCHNGETNYCFVM